MLRANPIARCWPLLLVGLCAQAQVPAGKGTQPGELDGGALVLGAVARCKSCHDRDLTAEPTLYLPFDGWVSTMMGNATRDPLFRAALTVANQDVPGIGSWCLRCHSPTAWVFGRTTPADGSALETLDHEGVTCEVCHRSIVPAGEPGAPFVFNAQLYWEPGNTRYGPYPNIASPGHDGAQSAFTGSSELCGQCHQVQNPLVPWRAADGGLLGPSFPLDTTYEEWKQSDYARLPPDAGFLSCADCHMPRFVGDGGLYPVGKTGPYRAAPRRHVFTGGNLWGLRAVQAANPELAQWSEQFAETEAQALATLRSAAELRLELPFEGPTGPVATVRVRVRNLTGHKLPSGYGDSRRAVVQLLVDGVPVAGRFDGGALLDEGMARVYEVVHGRAGLGPQEHLALHDTVVKDSRLPPRGLRATPATAPVGVAWYALPDGGLSDEDVFDVKLPMPEGLADGALVRLEAKLLYQSTTPHYVQFLRDENRTDDAGQLLHRLWRETGEAAPVEMARAGATLAWMGPSGGGGGAGGAGGGGSTGPATCACVGAPGSLGLLALAALLGVRRRRLFSGRASSRG